MGTHASDTGTWSRSASPCRSPILTVSQSDGRFEAVYQSSSAIPHRHATADERGRWGVSIPWSLDRPAAPNVLPERSSLRAEVLSQ